MKQQIAVLALLGLVQVQAVKMKMDLAQMTNEAQNVLNQFNVDQDDLDDGDQDDTLNVIRSPWKHNYLQESSDDESEDDEEMIQRTHEQAWVDLSRLEETSGSFAGFDAGLHGFIGNNHNEGEWKDAYARVLPNNYDQSDEVPVDLFTKNVLANFATEGVTAGGKPNREFFIVKDQAKILAGEVVETHLGLHGDEKAKFMKQRFDEAWDHYDVNKEGTMDAMWVSTFMRALCKPIKDIDLQ